MTPSIARRDGDWLSYLSASGTALTEDASPPSDVAERIIGTLGNLAVSLFGFSEWLSRLTSAHLPV